MLTTAHWISDPLGDRDVCPLFCKTFSVDRVIEKATLRASARGVYEAFLNGKRIGEQVLTPGWTVFEKRILFQEYDVTALLTTTNTLEIQLAGGWYHGQIASENIAWRVLPPEAHGRTCAVIAELELRFADGTCEYIRTDESWTVSDSAWRFCDIYDGLTYDATVIPQFDRYAVIAKNDDRSVLELSAHLYVLHSHSRCAFYIYKLYGL